MRSGGIIRRRVARDPGGDDMAKDRSIPTYTATLPSDFNQVLRQSFTQSLVRYYPPSEEMPPELLELLARLDKQNI